MAAKKSTWKRRSNLDYLGTLPVLGSRYNFSLGTTVTGGKFLYIQTAGRPGGIVVMADALDWFEQAVREYGVKVKAGVRLATPLCVGPRDREWIEAHPDLLPAERADHPYEDGHEELGKGHCRLCGYKMRTTARKGK